MLFRSSLKMNTTGSNNIGIGANAGQFNTTGNSNVSIGSGSLSQQTINVGNVAVGHYAAYWNTSGTGLTVVGYQALNANTTGVNNTIIGQLPAAAGCVCTVLIGAGTCERVKVDNSGLYINGSLFTGGSPLVLNDISNQ